MARRRSRSSVACATSDETAVKNLVRVGQLSGSRCYARAVLAKALDDHDRARLSEKVAGVSVALRAEDRISPRADARVAAHRAAAAGAIARAEVAAAALAAAELESRAPQRQPRRPAVPVWSSIASARSREVRGSGTAAQ